eukprot:m.307027 g.307027  ORF g.307027 m.307027 type:complete len:458 (+) comp41833_c0_seq1:418-1791(+)
MAASESSATPSCSHVAGRIKSFLQDRFRTEVILRRKVGEKSKETVDQMLAQGAIVSQEQVDSVQGSDLERGTTLLEIVRGGSDRLKENFAFALFALQQDEVLRKVHPEFTSELTRKCTNDYLQAEGDSAARHAFKRYLFLHLEKSDKIPVIVLVGSVGVGKSTLVGALLWDLGIYGHNPVSSSSDVVKPPENPQVYDAILDVPGKESGIRLQIIDCPGFQSNVPAAAKKLFQTLHEKVKHLDLLLYCIDAVNPRLTIESSLTIELLTAAFGKDIWKRALVLMMKANTIRATSRHEDDYAAFANKLAKLETGYSKVLIDKAKISQEVLNGIKFLPVGNDRDRQLADGCDWRPQFWSDALTKASIECASFLLLFNDEKLMQAITDNEIQFGTLQIEEIAESFIEKHRNLIAGGIAGGATVAGIALGAVLAGPVGAAVGGVIALAVGGAASIVVHRLLKS